MKCPICGRPTKIVASDPLARNGVRHTRVCTAPPIAQHPESMFNTVELLETIVKNFGNAKLVGEMERAQRGFERRAKSLDIHVRVGELLRAGKAIKEIAYDVGVSRTRVAQIARELTARADAAKLASTSWQQPTLFPNPPEGVIE